MSSSTILRPWLSRNAGPALIGIGALHAAVVLAAAGPVFGELLSEGWIGSVTPEEPERLGAFWSLLFGIQLAIIGALIRADRAPLPRAVPIALLALCLAGGLAMPPSGFWLGVAVAIALLRDP